MNNYFTNCCVQVPIVTLEWTEHGRLLQTYGGLLTTYQMIQVLYPRVEQMRLSLSCTHIFLVNQDLFSRELLIYTYCFSFELLRLRLSYFFIVYYIYVLTAN